MPALPATCRNRAFSANSQAKVAAMNIRGDLVGSKVFPAKYANTCWSLIETDDASRSARSMRPVTARSHRPRASSAMTEEDALRKANYEESVGWYAGITADMFG
jgi:sulfide dehydrogenase [flavocytochrome c] flavoprotein subunit